MPVSPQSTHQYLWRLCSQMLEPTYSRHWLLSRPCSQMQVPPQLFHLLLCRPCSQMEARQQSMHWLLIRPCSQMEAPPQLLHELLIQPCSPIGEPPQLLPLLLSRPCSKEPPQQTVGAWTVNFRFKMENTFQMMEKRENGGRRQDTLIHELGFQSSPKAARVREKGLDRAGVVIYVGFFIEGFF